MAENDLARWLNRLNAFQTDAHNILGTIESAHSRAITLDVSYQELDSLTLKQDELFRQSLRCVESELFRAAHVMAWAGLVDCLHSLVVSDGFIALNNARSNWNIQSIEDLAERFTEHALIEAIYVMNLITKSESKALFGMLSKRNECAHPGDYFPGLNETLGFISEIMARLKRLQNHYPGLSILP
jgi:hypothetical protein